ncbi:MAG: hypothetical protein AAF631_10825 [Pseudomonadota bacterium]
MPDTDPRSAAPGLGEHDPATGVDLAPGRLLAETLGEAVRLYPRLLILGLLPAVGAVMVVSATWAFQSQNIGFVGQLFLLRYAYAAAYLLAWTWVVTVVAAQLAGPRGLRGGLCALARLPATTPWAVLTMGPALVPAPGAFPIDGVSAQLIGFGLSAALLTWFGLAGPAIACGIGLMPALARARRLSRGNRLRLLLVLTICLGVGALGYAVCIFLTALIGQVNPVTVLLGLALGYAHVVYPLAVAIAVAERHLADLIDGPDPSPMAEVFE